MMFEELFQSYVEGFTANGEPYLKTIANCMVPSRVVRWKYKTLPPIETLPENERKELWDYANECFPDETKVFKILFCQIVYTIGTCI